MGKKTIIIELENDDSFILETPDPFGGFYEIRNPGGMYGYIHRQAVLSAKIIDATPTPPPPPEPTPTTPSVLYVIEANAVNVRPTPSTSNAAKYKLLKGTEVAVEAIAREDRTLEPVISLSASYKWVQLKSDGNYFAISTIDDMIIYAKRKA